MCMLRARASGIAHTGSNSVSYYHRQQYRILLHTSSSTRAGSRFTLIVLCPSCALQSTSMGKPSSCKYGTRRGKSASEQLQVVRGGTRVAGGGPARAPGQGSPGLCRPLFGLLRPGGVQCVMTEGTCRSSYMGCRTGSRGSRTWEGAIPRACLVMVAAWNSCNHALARLRAFRARSFTARRARRVSQLHFAEWSV